MNVLLIPLVITTISTLGLTVATGRLKSENNQYKTSYMQIFPQLQHCQNKPPEYIKVPQEPYKYVLISPNGETKVIGISVKSVGGNSQVIKCFSETDNELCKMDATNSIEIYSDGRMQINGPEAWGDIEVSTLIDGGVIIGNDKTKNEFVISNGVVINGIVSCDMRNAKCINGIVQITGGIIDLHAYYSVATLPFIEEESSEEEETKDHIEEETNDGFEIPPYSEEDFSEEEEIKNKMRSLKDDNSEEEEKTVEEEQPSYQQYGFRGIYVGGPIYSQNTSIKIQGEIISKHAGFSCIGNINTTDYNGIHVEGSINSKNRNGIYVSKTVTGKTNAIYANRITTGETGTLIQTAGIRSLNKGILITGDAYSEQYLLRHTKGDLHTHWSSFQLLQNLKSNVGSILLVNGNLTATNNIVRVSGKTTVENGPFVNLGQDLIVGKAESQELTGIAFQVNGTLTAKQAIVVNSRTETTEQGIKTYPANLTAQQGIVVNGITGTTNGILNIGDDYISVNGECIQQCECKSS